MNFPRHFREHSWTHSGHIQEKPYTPAVQEETDVPQGLDFETVLITFLGTFFFKPLSKGAYSFGRERCTAIPKDFLMTVLSSGILKSPF